MGVAKSDHASRRVHGCAFAFQSIEKILGLSAWFFSPNGILDANTHSVDFRQRCQIVPLVRKTLKCPDCGTEILLSSAHSDMKDMAYFYVYPLYEELSQKGPLQ